MNLFILFNKRNKILKIKQINNKKSICITAVGQCNIGRPPAKAILTKSYVVEGFVTQRPNSDLNLLRFS